MKHILRRMIASHAVTGIILAFLIALAPHAAEASTWTPVLDDTFNRADTTAGAANSTTGVGNNWTDTAGGMWNISSSQLQGYTTLNADFRTKFLTRPSAENATDTRITVDIPANEDISSAILALGLRWQSSNSYYYMAHITASSIWIYKVKGASAPILANAGASLDTSHAHRVEFTALGTNPTNLTLTVTDLTASSSPSVLTATDSESSLQGEGTPVLSVFNNGASYIHASRVQTFVNTDVTGPVVSGITATTTYKTATIGWSTDELASSTIEYGTTTSYGSIVSSSTLATSHSLTISGLSTSASYHYRIISTDDTGNLSTTTDMTFTTTELTPVAYWKFDEASSSSDAVDYAGSNTGIQTGSPLSTTTVPSVNFTDTGSRVFDGSNYFTVNRPVQDNFTICAWIKTSSAGGGTNHWQSAPIMDSEWGGLAYDFGFGIGNGGRLMFGNGGTYDSQVNGSATINDNAWHNVCATRNGTTGAVRLYVDAQLDGTGTTSTGTLSRNPYARIGYGYDGAANYVGLIDDVRVYDTDLTQTQLYSLSQGNDNPDAPVSSGGGCGSVTTIVGSVMYTTKCGVTTVFDTNPGQAVVVATAGPASPALQTVENSSLPALLPAPVPASTSAAESADATRAVAPVAAPVSYYQFPRSLRKGMTGSDVKELQKFLNAHGFTVSATGAGSVGKETSFFGPATDAAVRKFQAAYGSEILSPQDLGGPTGLFYSYTRAKANAMLKGEI